MQPTVISRTAQTARTWHKFLYRGTYFRACFVQGKIYLDYRSFKDGNEWSPADPENKVHVEAGDLCKLWISSEYHNSMNLDHFINKVGK